MSSNLPKGVTMTCAPERDPTPVIFRIDLREVPQGDDLRGSPFGGRTLARIEITDAKGRTGWAHVSLQNETMVVVNAVNSKRENKATVKIRPWQKSPTKAPEADSTIAVPLDEDQERVLQNFIKIAEQHVSDDGMPSVIAVAAFAIGNGRTMLVSGELLNAVPLNSNLAALARSLLHTPWHGKPPHAVRTRAQMGEITLDGVCEHLRYLAEENPNVVYHPRPRSTP